MSVYRYEIGLRGAFPILLNLRKKRFFTDIIRIRARKRGPPEGGRPGWFFQTKLEAATL